MSWKEPYGECSSNLPANPNQRPTPRRSPELSMRRAASPARQRPDRDSAGRGAHPKNTPSKSGLRRRNGRPVTRLPLHRPRSKSRPESRPGPECDPGRQLSPIIPAPYARRQPGIGEPSPRKATRPEITSFSSFYCLMPASRNAMASEVLSVMNRCMLEYFSRSLRSRRKG